MSLTERIKNLSKAKKIAFAGAGAVLIAGIVAAVILLAGNGYTATTMRLLRVEGSVNIENSKGETKPVIDKIRFQSGDALNTGDDGIASVGLDDTKIVTLQSDSRVEFQKQNKKLELKLTKGALYFEVTEHLKDDETYEIHTSNMTVGIRGTSGYVYYDESDKRESLIITDGVVEVSATNPKTGETKTARVEGGKQIKVYLVEVRKGLRQGPVLCDFRHPLFDGRQVFRFQLHLTKTLRRGVFFYVHPPAGAVPHQGGGEVGQLG